MTDNSEEAECKIADFHCAKIFGPNELNERTMGTFAYCAPEIILDEPCGKEVDLWALGVIIFVLLSGSFPFYSTDKKEAMRLAIIGEPDVSA